MSVVRADIGRDTEPLIKIGQRNLSVPSIQVELVGETQGFAVKAQVGVARKHIDRGHFEEALRGSQRANHQSGKGKYCSLSLDREHPPDCHQPRLILLKVWANKYYSSLIMETQFPAFPLPCVDRCRLRVQRCWTTWWWP